MLPSTGYFKGLFCPFYDSGLCERPYCHFRHAKKDPNSAGEAIENGAILQQLVSEAVKKVLQQTEPALVTGPVVKPSGKLTYNPTPIAELNKIQGSDSAGSGDDADAKPRRHIPVPYTPHRPTTGPVKRVADDVDSSKPFIYNPPVSTYSPGSGECKTHDPYLPHGGTSNSKYEPGSEVELQTYVPPVASTSPVSDKASYVPSSSDKPQAKNKIIEYEPTHASVNAGMSKYMEGKLRKESESALKTKNNSSGLKYQPTPLSKVPCFSSDEDEPELKKKKKNESLNGVDLDHEFEMLGQILEEENTSETGKTDRNLEKSIKSNNEEKLVDKDKQIEKRTKPTKEKSHTVKSFDKTDHKSSREKDKRDIDKAKSRSNSTKSNKSSHKERDKVKEKDRDNRKNEKSSKEDKSKSKSSSSKEKSSHISEKSSKSSSSRKHSDRFNDLKSSRSSKSDSSRHDKNYKKENKSSKDKYKKKSSKDKKTPENRNGVSDCEIFSDGANSDGHMEEISDADEDTIAMECMKIFEEYVPTSKPTNEQDVETNHEQVEEYIPGKKRISRTVDKPVKVIERPPVKPDFKVSAAQAMAQRLSKVREYHALKNISTNPIEPVDTPVQKPDNPNVVTLNPSKVRIAHVPNVMLYAKKPASTVSQSDQSKPSTSTVVQTIPKGSNRTAHIPNDKFCDRPGVLEPLASKIPANMRSTFLNKMIDECLKIYVTPTDAYARAQQEELSTSKKCNTIPIYKNSAMLTVSRLRKELQDSDGVKKTSYEIDPTKISHSQVLLGKLTQTSWSIQKTKKTCSFVEELKGLQFYKNISQWILDEEQLQQNGFPRLHPDGEKGWAKIYIKNERQIPPRGRLRTCCRCKKEYTVDKRGFPVVKEDCNYHPNRKYRFRGEAKYQCCSQDESSEGCCIAPTHVFEYLDYDNLRGFVRTLPKDVPDPDNYDFGVYALDCEMCYTTHGLDLTRITVINSACKIVYETLIKPLHPIIDYNTRYSGITEEQMEHVSTTLIEVQATLLSMFSNKTILIGHSLESDFKVLKIIHNTVIDTSVLFPHKMGPPYKRALRNLSSEHLKKIIQNSVDGHDSAEDATVCMELIQWKLKEELKIR